MWDLLIRGERLIDPATGHDGRADVAVRDGTIVEVRRDLAGEAAEVVEAPLVVPGLVDLHTHVWHGAGYWSIDPDPIAWRTGVTTWVDAGSAGAYGVAGLRRVADLSTVRLRALMNVSCLGLTAETGESRTLDHLNIDDAVTVAARNRDFVLGVKARIDRHTVGGNGLEPLRRAVTLAGHLDRPLMVHIGHGPPAIADIMPLLRPGDILTHCASGAASGLVTGGRMGEALRTAAGNGVIFDLGHGMGGFEFATMEAELESGIRPIISSDLHARSVNGPAYDLPTVMSKMTALGWSLYDVVEAATVRPAEALGLAAGSLSPGAPADIALFAVEEGRFPVTDAFGGSRIAPMRLINSATYVGGRRLAPMAAAEPPPWV